jgi:MFS transporter, DHA2 family, multidrug resistance protein
MASLDIDARIATRATQREWVGLAVIALPCMLYSMDLTVLNLAVPALARNLNPTASQLLWIIDIYGFMVAGCLMVMGSLGDRLGRRRILLIGAAAFGAASILAAFAQTAEQLIAARALLGIAGATLAPSTLSLITSMFRDEAQRSFAIGIWIMSFSAGAIIGPVAGGLLIEYFWWGSVFLVGVPVMVLLLVLGPILLPEYRDPNAGRIDYASAALSLMAVLSVIWGVKHWAETGAGAMTLGALAAGAVLVAVFLNRQTRLADPLVDLTLFRSRVFSLTLSVNTVSLFFMFGTFVFTAQYLQLVLGLTPLMAGLWSLPGAIAFTIAAPIAGSLATRFPPARVLAGGLLLAAAGFVVLGTADGLHGVVLANLLTGVGFTPVLALTTGFVVGAAPVEKAGIASALSETGAELGGATGIALIGSLITAIYTTRMSAVAIAADPDLAEAARLTLAGAVKAAETMAPQSAGDMLAVARVAFTDAFHLAALVAAAALVMLAALSARVLARSNLVQH